jgi:hypothetical protein
MSRLAVALVAFLCVSVEPGSAQSPQAPQLRVRITDVNGAVVTGSLVSATAEQLGVVSGRNGREYIIPLSGISGMEESLGRHRRFGRNFAIGLVSTAGVLGALAAATWSPCTQTGFMACLLHPGSRAEAFTWGLAGGGVVGLPVGVVAGLAIKEERWAPAVLPRAGEATLRVVPAPHNSVGLAAVIPVGDRSRASASRWRWLP